MWHYRARAAGTTMLYFKINAWNCDPIGEDPLSDDWRAATLRTAGLRDEELTRAVPLVGRKVDYFQRRFTRDWQEAAAAVLSGEGCVLLDEQDWRMLRAIDGRRTVADCSGGDGRRLRLHPTARQTGRPRSATAGRCRAGGLPADAGVKPPHRRRVASRFAETFCREASMKSTSGHPAPVILLGGAANALSVARCLGRRGVRVYALNDHYSHVRYSRFARYLPAPWMGSDEATWTAYLLGPQSGRAARRRVADALRRGHRDHRPPPRTAGGEIHPRRLQPRRPAGHARQAATAYEAARAAGVPTPRFWRIETLQDVLRVEGELVFPLLIKPLLSHQFWDHFGGKKYLKVHDFAELADVYRAVSGAGVAAMLVERIPGPDDRLCSYYTYLDENTRPLFHFTKRIIRRFPTNMGEGSCHVTDWNPEVRDLALRLFRHVGLRGMANAEFMRDERDGRLKLIECNARFTAADCLVAASGIDLGSFVYARLTGRPLPPMDRYRVGLRLWNPGRDFKAFRELRRNKQLSLAGWLRSIAHWPMVFPYFRWDDPMPTVVDALRGAGWTRPMRRLSARCRAVVARVGRLLGFRRTPRRTPPNCRRSGRPREAYVHRSPNTHGPALDDGDRDAENARASAVGKPAPPPRPAAAFLGGAVHEPFHHSHKGRAADGPHRRARARRQADQGGDRPARQGRRRPRATPAGSDRRDGVLRPPGRLLPRRRRRVRRGGRRRRDHARPRSRSQDSKGPQSALRPPRQGPRRGPAPGGRRQGLAHSHSVPPTS